MGVKRILVVEDDYMISEGIKTRLDMLDYIVIGPVASGEKAISAAKKEKPDLVLMDIMLNGEIDGIQAAENIRENCDIPIVYLTAFSYLTK